MRKIKFRGETLDGRIFFGDLIQSSPLEPSIFDGTHRYYIKPETVAQFLGYDADGREVYEGDVVVDELGVEIALFAEIGGYDFRIGEKITYLRLKED